MAVGASYGHERGERSGGSEGVGSVGGGCGDACEDTLPEDGGAGIKCAICASRGHASAGAQSEGQSRRASPVKGTKAVARHVHAEVRFALVIDMGHTGGAELCWTGGTGQIQKG